MHNIKNKQYYKKLFNNAHEVILVMYGHHFMDGNEAALKKLKMASFEDLNKIHPSQISPLHQPDGELSSKKADRMIETCYQTGFHQFEWMHKDLENNEFLVEVTLKTIEIDNHTMLHVIWRDIENEKKSELALLEQNKTLIQKNEYINNIYEILSSKDNQKTLLESIFLLEEYKKAIDESSIVSKTDPKGIITYVNDKFCEISGYTKEELIGQNHNVIRHPDTQKSFFVDLWNTIKNKRVFKGIIQNRKKNGDSYYVDSTIIPILDKENKIVEYIGIRHDITSVFEKDKLLYEQFTDELTLLPNRQKLLNDIKNVLFPKLAIINIDRFKDINDSYGLEIGDFILKEVSEVLKQYKSTNLTVYRIAGDIFAFLAYGNFKFEELIKTCNDFLLKMDKNSITVEDNFFNISSTIGVAEGKNKILTHAEIALKAAREENKDLVIFNENMEIYKKLKENINLIKDIKWALQNDGILMYGQKIIDNYSNTTKYETLMRMKLENGQIISPFKFLKHAKKARLYSQLTKLIIQKACNHFKNTDIEFSLNLMLEDIKNKETINFLIETLQKTDTAKQVILEIVEEEGIEKFVEVEEFIKKVKAIGCRVAIDDFGTGYSNFEYIIRLNIDILKIDGSLIKNINTNDNIKLTVSTIVNFAKVLGIHTVAEFVHCKEVDDIVKEMGIEYSQGFYHHEPELLV